VACAAVFVKVFRFEKKYVLTVTILLVSIAVGIDVDTKSLYTHPKNSLLSPLQKNAYGLQHIVLKNFRFLPRRKFVPNFNVYVYAHYNIM